MGRAKKKPPAPPQQGFTARKLRAPRDIRGLLQGLHEAVPNEANERMARLLRDGAAVVEPVAWLRQTAEDCPGASVCRKAVLRFLDALKPDVAYFEVCADGSVWTADRRDARRFRLLNEINCSLPWSAYRGMTLEDYPATGPPFERERTPM